MTTIRGITSSKIWWFGIYSNHHQSIIHYQKNKMEQVIKEYDQEFDEEFELVLSQMGKITHKDKW